MEESESEDLGYCEPTPRKSPSDVRSSTSFHLPVGEKAAGLFEPRATRLFGRDADDPGWEEVEKSESVE